MRARSMESRYRPPRDEALPLDLRRQALGRGVAVVVIEDCRDDWTRQAVVNEARRQIEEGREHGDE